ncbi:coiled-coil domain-containing protein 142 isoform X2 [Rissa tridactyla]|uniref:coiled-coil domain-containing protein 142 isoform X2 n=1 Tax=Rissa tridactyla TaxID=75485 RepID=UPI0023BAC9A5|nr:coiled-coil domain-containing protein 142 isoform X2 [Rissa tridactyla]
MEDGGPERRAGEPCLQVGEGGGAGLSDLILLLLTARPPLPAPGDGATGREPAETGSSSLGGLARSLQKAEAMLRSCVSPGLRRLLPSWPRERSYGSSEDEEEEEEEEMPALLTLLEQSFPGLHRCLYVWENPRTETFRGHVRPQPGDSAAATAFSYHPVHPRVAERGAALHALLQHRHHLRLVRDYSRRLKAASDFLRRLLVLVERPEPPAGELGATQPLRGLCQELRTHAGHWSGLRRRMRSDLWLRPLLLRRHESVAHMRRVLLLLALHAARLAERHVEARLRGLARASPATAAPPALLSDLFQGLEIYNQVVGNLALELGIARCLPTGIAGCHGATGDRSNAFPVARVLGILAAERGQLVAKRLQPLLQLRDGGSGAEHVCWEDATVPWPPEHGTTAADAGPSGREESLGLARELQALCREDEELMGLVLGALVASADSLWHHILHGPKQEKLVVADSPESLEPPVAGLGMATRPSSAGWKSVRWLDASRAPAAEALHAQYRPLFWGATSTVLGHRLGPPHYGASGATAAAWELSRALAQARVPRECEEELGRLCLRLLCRGVLRSWEQDFARTLGSGLSDKCSGEPVPAAGPVWSRTARCLQRLYPALAFALRCLRPLPARLPGHPPGSPCLRLQVLGCCLATAQAACSWLMGRACRYLAAWALPQFLLVTQGDLQLLKTETDRLVVLVSGTFPEPGDAPRHLPPALLSHQEHQLCQQIRSMAASIQLFSGDVLKMFSTNCKRMSAEIFDQTMPLGKHWRVGLRADLPSSPSEYAAAAAQAVLGQVLQGAQLLPRDAQAPALARVTTAFLEAWMDHILAQRIKFSLQGALQLRQDFELVRELVGSERYGLAPETRQSLLSLRVFQQMDGAILCLLQQPGGLAGVPPRPWHSLRHCCSDNGAQPQEPAAGSLHGLETLEVPGAAAGTPPSTPDAEVPGRLRSGVPESYLSGSQQQWLSLRLHRARRWRVPGLPCVGNSPET